MKVALIGNMNNNFFVLQRYLLDEGIDCHLFLFPNESIHFLPDCDSWDIDVKDLYTRLKWGNKFDFLKTTNQEITNSFVGFSHFIGCGSSPAFLRKIGISLDLFIPYGSDLYDLPFKNPRNPLRWINSFSFNNSQKLGIRNAKNISIADNSKLLLTPLKRVKYRGVLLNSGVPLVYSEKAKNAIEDVGTFVTEFKNIRKKFDLIVFHHSRHVWKTQKDPVSVKRNDKLIRAVGNMVNSNMNIALVTLEYGDDVKASKDLISELGIEANVFWFPKMARKELMFGIENCDIVAGEFNNSWFTYGVVFEAMAKAKPILHFRDDSLYPDFNLYPMLNAFTENEITQQLKKGLSNPEELRELGELGKQWYFQFFVKNSLNEIKMALGLSQ